MQRSAIFEKSTSGKKVIGSAPGSDTLQRAVLSISRCIGFAQCAQAVTTLTAVSSPSNCPCTKGTANASIAQAEYKVSPDLNVILCGVSCAVTG